MFEDNDKSAYNGRERPEYQRLIHAVVGGDVDVVVAWHTDRLWANVIEQQTFLKMVATRSSSSWRR